MVDANILVIQWRNLLSAKLNSNENAEFKTVKK